LARADTRSLGAGAERAAERFLCKNGLTPLARNFRCRFGEIDLIALDDSALVFIEVRRRGPRSYSPAAMTVDRRKQQKLIRAAALFTAKRPRYGLCVMRFDVVAIDVNERGAQSIEWFRDAFRPADSQL
jgi:putative endonuclease